MFHMHLFDMNSIPAKSLRYGELRPRGKTQGPTSLAVKRLQSLFNWIL